MTEYTVRPGDVIRVDSGIPPTPNLYTPPDVLTWLMGRGWVEINPTADDIWEHKTKGRVGMRWEQAVACEFYEFITLGGR